MSFAGLSNLKPKIQRPDFSEGSLSHNINLRVEPMTMTQLNEYYDRILLGNLCKKCDQDFVAEEMEFCPKCSKRPEITTGAMGG